MSENLNNEKINENETSTVVTEVQGVHEGHSDPNETVNGPGSTNEVVPEGRENGEESVSQDGENEEQQDTFPRAYVEKLRKESAKYRERAGRADALEQQLHAALVRLDGRLADPEDLEFNAEHLENPDALAAAISELVERKPGLKAQQVGGDVGAGKRGSEPKPTMDLLSIMKGM